MQINRQLQAGQHRSFTDSRNLSLAQFFTPAPAPASAPGPPVAAAVPPTIQQLYDQSLGLGGPGSGPLWPNVWYFRSENIEAGRNGNSVALVRIPLPLPPPAMEDADAAEPAEPEVVVLESDHEDDWVAPGDIGP